MKFSGNFLGKGGSVYLSIMNAIITQIKNEENKIYDWLVYHINEGFDTIVLIDDHSTDKTIDIVNEVREQYNVNIIVEESVFLYFPELKSEFGNFLDRQVRSINRGLQIVKEIDNEGTATFIDPDEFMVTNEIKPVVQVIREMMNEENCNEILFHNFDVKSGYDYGRGFTKDETTKYRWSYEGLENNGHWNSRRKGTILVKYANDITFVHVPNQNEQAIMYWNENNERLRMHHYRTPNLTEDITDWSVDYSIIDKMKKIL